MVGFGAQLAWWSTGRWQAGRYGLLDYRAAVLGDGIFIPVVAGLLAALLWNERHPLGARDRAMTLSAATLGALAGAAVQASWLLDPSAVTNWTLPRAHHFSSPGWYHVCYLVIASASISAAGTLAARTVRAAAPAIRQRLADGWGLALLWMCGGAFTSVLSLDGSGSSATSASGPH